MKYNYESLKNYALWYYFKYFPSVKKLLQKLQEKSSDRELDEKVYKSISHLIDEKQVIGDKIRLYLMRNKNLNYIKSKLILAGFEKETVLEILNSNFLVEGESLLNKKSLFIKIENYKNAGKSINYIKNKLIERQEDRELIEGIIEEIFNTGEEENILREIEKLSKKYDKVNGTRSRESPLGDKQKITQKLIAKGFNYNEIKKYV